MSHDFHPLRIAQVRRETADTMSIALAVPPELTDAYRFRPGQHLVVRSMLDGAEMRRTYSISSGPDDNELWLTIKRVDGGQFSSHAHQHFKPDSTIEAMPPAGRFVVPPPNGRARSFVAIAAGSGITPVMAMIRQVLAAEPESRFTLIYGNRSFDSIIFREALADLKDRYLDRLMVVHVLSREADADVPELNGHIDAAKVEHFMTSLVSVSDVDQFFLCGPGSLIKDAFQQLKAMGVPRERVHFEYFKAGPEVAERPSRPAPQPSSNAPQEGVPVVVTIDGARYAFRVQRGEHVVDAAIAAGVRVPYSCKGGMCCTCRAKLVEGSVEMTRNFSLEPWEIDAGFVLTCQSRPTSDRVVLDYDQL